MLRLKIRTAHAVGHKAYHNSLAHVARHSERALPEMSLEFAELDTGVFTVRAFMRLFERVSIAHVTDKLACGRV